ncbi:MAG: beta-ketoacyl synthase N-terminal-like domain-containing protein, partial [Gammaproteobacteria bacterium]
MTDSGSGEQQDTVLGGIAIIGMAGRFPGAKNIDQFWRNLCAGVESITRFTDAELEDNFSAEERSAPNFVKARPILEDVDQFDADFFGMYSREAELTDPQHRIFLECAWEALESAGYDPATVQGPIGVFGGCSINTYFLNNVCGERRTIEEFASNYQVGCYPMLLGAGLDFLTTRVAYKLDLRGPTFTLQTACSTSLLAVAQAAQSLLLYQADMALAGGVSVTFPQKRGYQHLDGGMVSADGTCRPFDADATGTIFGSGAGVVLLKRLEDAVADGDHIYAVIRGTGINNDGASKVGFTAPSVSGQAICIDMALASAGVDARSISYVECHGTATPLGDPIEVAGLTKAFGAATSDLQFCALGSVKGNIGHLDAAAGVTGLIKTALALKHRMLPPSLHYKRPNPQIDFAKTPFFVNASLRPWPETQSPRRAGVSAFGVGGTNVHVVLEEPPAAVQALAEGGNAAATGSELLVLSAKTPAALDAARKNLSAHLLEHPELPLADVAYSLQVGRRVFDQRLAFVARNRDEALAKLEGRDQLNVHAGRRPPKAAEVVFMFPGQGAQYPDMGKDLFERYPEFRQNIEQCAKILAPLRAKNLLDLLYPAVNSPEAKQELMSTVAAQPAIFSVEYALAKLWMSWGIRPTAMIGHSVGEFVAAVLSGVMSLQDALTVVAARGRLMQELPGGAMMAVRLAESELLPLMVPDLAIAAINGPALCVVAGPYAAVDAFEASLTARNVVTRRLHTSHAFHSAMVDPVIEPLRRELQRVEFSAPTIPYVSCVTGDWITAAQAVSPDYWARHARQAVRFADGVAKVSASGSAVLLEVGPGNALTTLAVQATRGRGVPVISSMQDAVREHEDGDRLLDAAGRLFTQGVLPDWVAVRGATRHRVPLPTYPFERSRHWINAPAIVRADAQAVYATVAVALPAEAPAAAAPIIADTILNINPQDLEMNDIRTAIAAILEDLSGERPESIDSDMTFLEMGYDSLFLTQVAQKIQSQMNVKITFRQLLGDYSTIPTLAGLLHEKMPKSARPAPAAAPAAPAAVAAPAAATAPSPVTAAAPMRSAAPALTALSGVAPSGVEAIFRDQLQAMQQLMSRQFDVLQGFGPAALAPAAAPVAQHAAPAHAAAPAVASSAPPAA